MGSRDGNVSPCRRSEVGETSRGQIRRRAKNLRDLKEGRLELAAASTRGEAFIPGGRGTGARSPRFTEGRIESQPGGCGWNLQNVGLSRGRCARDGGYHT